MGGIPPVYTLQGKCDPSYMFHQQVKILVPYSVKVYVHSTFVFNQQPLLPCDYPTYIYLCYLVKNNLSVLM